ncbi:hypothetical protein DFP89_103206 [Paracoccus lutimaris]|uniref:Uncharacterized protein n=2 Tax=Paracoccus lutimaris TaxID=1490030 RepID=A0A368Z419_9RHOB|nr:hypothetical protein DFP89_103206 [Paracoccus lutimaris]
MPCCDIRNMKFLGFPIGDIFGGVLLCFGVVTALFVSIAIMPELSWRGMAQGSATYKTAAIALRARDEVADRLDSYHTEYLKLLTDDAPNTNMLIRRDGLSKGIQDETAALAAAEAEVTRIRRDLSDGPAAVDALQLARHSWRWKCFDRATPDQLILLLTLLMGFLGGIISVARAFLTADSSDQPTPADYVIRPLMGIVVAFVFYLLVQVAQITLSTAGNTDKLNPIPIALIAVVAGMMANEALGAVDSWGKTLMARISTGTPADELKAMLAEQRKRLEEVTKKLPTSAPRDQTQQYKAAKPAHTAAEEALKRAEEAVKKAAADNSSSATVAAANAALADLKAKIAAAETLTAAIP